MSNGSPETGVACFRSPHPCPYPTGDFLVRDGGHGWGERKHGTRSFTRLAIVFTAVVLTSGCTSWQEYVHNGFKVGPNYCKPPAPVAKDWIDADDQRVRTTSDDLSKWWTVFNDPVLDSLICYAYQQNLSLRVAGMRVLEARAQLAIDVGNLLPQTQTSTGDFKWNGISNTTANNFLQFSAPPGGFPGVAFPPFKRWYGQWDLGFNLSWEIDFWGRFRRAVEADSASLDASVENYDDVLVTLLGQVATTYAQMRITEQQIKYAQANVDTPARDVGDRRGAASRAARSRSLTWPRPGARWSKQRPPSPCWRLACGNPTTSCASCSVSRRNSCGPSSARAPSRRRPWRWPSASRPTCCAAARTSAGRSARPPRSRPRSAWPRPNSTRTSPSTAPGSIRPSSSRTSGGPRP